MSTVDSCPITAPLDRAPRAAPVKTVGASGFEPPTPRPPAQPYFQYPRESAKARGKTEATKGRKKQGWAGITAPLLPRVILTAALVGCAAPSEVTLSFPDATDAQLAAAQEAAAEWNACPGVSVHVTREPDGIRLGIVPAGSLGGNNAMTRRRIFKVWVEVEANSAERRRTYAHEMGHVLGLDHADRGIMSVGDASLDFEHVLSEDCP
jgi:hypothetical protein